MSSVVFTASIWVTAMAEDEVPTWLARVPGVVNGTKEACGAEAVPWFGAALADGTSSSDSEAKNTDKYQ